MAHIGLTEETQVFLGPLSVFQVKWGERRVLGFRRARPQNINANASAFALRVAAVRV